ncbi:MAG: FAD-dependent oxidoreductase [Candidatus Alcyoniella australis]|nr:FAD-dependent oxidoreductase [Candidatus Alcyoniella australis]
MSNQGKRLIVIGGVAGGTSAASRARRIDPQMEITLFERDRYVSYGACDEPYFISGEVPTWERLLVRSPEEFEGRQNIRIRLRHEASAVDPQARSVTVRDLETGAEQTHQYDRLILATGARPRTLDAPGADAANVFSLKFLDQARAIDDFIRQRTPKRVAIVGAGFIALEMAEALSARGLEVTILHRSSKPGGRAEQPIAELIIQTLQANGVRYVPDCKVQQMLLDDQGLVCAVQTDCGEFETQMVLTALGVEPAVELACAAGCEIGPSGAIAVDERQQTSVDGIYAAGDCCQSLQRISNEPVYAPLGDVANKQGWTAGENAAGGDARFAGVLQSMHFKCFDLQVGYTGLTLREAQQQFDACTQLVKHRSRAHAQPKGVPINVMLIADRGSRRLLGAQMAGTEGVAHRINSLAVALYAGMTVDQLNEVDFAYAPPFSAVIDPILMAARVMQKKL